MFLKFWSPGQVPHWHVHKLILSPHCCWSKFLSKSLQLWQCHKFTDPLIGILSEKANPLLQSHLPDSNPQGPFLSQNNHSLGSGEFYLLPLPGCFQAFRYLVQAQVGQLAYTMNWMMNLRYLSKMLSSGLEIKFHAPWCHLFFSFSLFLYHYRLFTQKPEGIRLIFRHSWSLTDADT